MPKDPGFYQTRMQYRLLSHGVMNQGKVLLTEAPRHVPVLAEDLAHMLNELLELDYLREQALMRGIKRGG